jgi:hypothetical protein
MKDKYVPPKRLKTLAENVDIAKQFRKKMTAGNKTSACSVCAMRKAPNEIKLKHWHLDDFWVAAERHLLAYDESNPQTARTLEQPRSSLTVCTIDGVKYCLQEKDEERKLVYYDEALHDWVLSVCIECEAALCGKRPSCPRKSLVYVDTGAIPADCKPLSVIEEQLLGFHFSHRKIFVMRPNGGDPTTKQWNWRGHLVVVPNVDVRDVMRCMPLRLEDVPQTVQVSGG